MAQIVFKYLAIYNNEKLSNSIKIGPKRFQNFTKYEINLKIANIFNFLPSGKISPNLVTLLSSRGAIFLLFSAKVLFLPETNRSGAEEEKPQIFIAHNLTFANNRILPPPNSTTRDRCCKTCFVLP